MVSKSNSIIDSIITNSDEKEKNDKFYENISGRIQNDFRNDIVSDPAIMSYGKMLFQPNMPFPAIERLNKSIRSDMRYLLKLKIKINEGNVEKIKSIGDALQRDKFDHVCAAVNSLSKIKDNGNENASVTTIFGRILPVLTNTLITELEKDKSDNDEKKNKKLNDLNKFLNIFKFQWKYQVSKTARFVMRTKKLPAQNIVPLEDDLILFNSGLKKKN